MPTTEAKAPDETVGAPPQGPQAEELQFMEGLQDKDKDGAVVADSAPKGSTEPKNCPAARRSNPMTWPMPNRARRQRSRPSLAHPGTSQKPGQGRSEKAVRQTRRKAGWRKIPRTPTKSPPSRPRTRPRPWPKRLSAKGLSASVHEAKSNNRKMFRVHIQLRGTAEEITEGLKKSGEKGPILLDKTPL
jgi:hypothetical protein